MTHRWRHLFLCWHVRTVCWGWCETLMFCTQWSCQHHPHLSSSFIMMEGRMVTSSSMARQMVKLALCSLAGENSLKCLSSSPSLFRCTNVELQVIFIIFCVNQLLSWLFVGFIIHCQCSFCAISEAAYEVVVLQQCLFPLFHNDIYLSILMLVFSFTGTLYVTAKVAGINDCPIVPTVIGNQYQGKYGGYPM